MAKRFSQTVDLGSDFNVDALWAEEKRRRQLQQQQAQQQPQKNWLVDQISTVGGIGGGILGALLGTAAGPVGNVAGAAGGSALGSGAGQWLENLITGEKDQLKGVGEEAAMGALFGAGPIRATNIALQGVKAAAKGAGKQGIKEAAEKAAKATPIRDALKLARGGQSAEKLGQRMIASQAQVTGSQARQLGIKPVETIGRVAQRTGLTKLDDMAEFGRTLTGQGDNSILDVLTREAVGSTNGVDVGDLRAAATKLLDSQGTLLSDEQRKTLLRNVKNASVGMRGGSSGSLNPLANPDEALNAANNFRAAAQSIKSRPLTASPEQAQIAKIYDNLAKNIEDSIYSSPGVGQSIPDLARYGSTSLREMAGEAAAAGNNAQAEAYRRLAKEVEGIKSVKDLRSLKKDFVGIGQIDNLTAQAEGARAFNAEDATSLMRGSPVKGAIAAATGSALPRIGGKLASVGRKAQGAGAANGARQAVTPGGVATRLGILGALTGEQPTQPLPQALQALETPQNGLEAATATQMPMQEPSIGGVTKSQIEAAMVQAAADGETDAFSQLQAIYSLLPKEQGLDLNASTAAMAAKQATGGQALDTLLAQYEAAGGGQGAIGGSVANILGGVGINPNAGAYNDSVAGTARQLSRAMGETGAGSDSDAQAYISQMPRLTDTPEQAQLKIDRLRQMLAAARQNTLMYGAGATSDLSSYQ